MSIFKLTPSGKCDVTITLFNKDNSMLLQRSLTFDSKPTIKSFKDEHKPFKNEGAVLMRITTTPSCGTRTIKL